MKGIVSLIEVAITGVILMLAFFHFFPKYSIKSNWDTVLLDTQVKDILNVIENMEKTNIYATDKQEFDLFMQNVLATSEQGAVIWWEDTEGLGLEDPQIPHFTKAQKATIVDATDVIFNDDFRNANNIWTPSGGEWIIQDERYKATSGSTEISLTSFNIIDAEIKSEIEISSGKKAGIAFRAQNNTHYYAFVGDAQTNKWRLEKWENGASTEIEFVNDKVDTGKKYNITAVMDGTNFSGYVNDTLIITHNSLDFENGHTGLFIEDATAYFDDFSINGFTIYSFTLGIGYPY